MSKNILGRDILSTAPTRARSEVSIPEWDGVMLVQEMDGLEAAHFQRRMMETMDQARGLVKDAKGLAELNAFVIICGCIDGEGKRIFSSADEQAIIGWGNSIQESLVSEILNLSGITPAGKLRLKKNSKTTQSDASGSG